jgi:four helix bundle protein
MGSFQDILVWQKSKGFYVELYHDFSGLKEFYFKDQILHAALSISNNIAEGHDRRTDK